MFMLSLSSWRFDNMIYLDPPKPLEITAGEIELLSDMMRYFPQGDNSLAVVEWRNMWSMCVQRFMQFRKGECNAEVSFCIYNSQVSPKRLAWDTSVEAIAIPTSIVTEAHAIQTGVWAKVSLKSVK